MKKPRAKQVRQEDLPSSASTDTMIRSLAGSLASQIEKDAFQKKYAPAADVLKLVGAGAFFAASLAVPNLPRVLRPFATNQKEYYAWKRFNIPYLKRTLERLEREKLVQYQEQSGMQTVELTQRGKRKIMKGAFDAITIKKPSRWDRSWRLISYDIPRESHSNRAMLRKHLTAWGFYPLQESVFLHAYPCESEVDSLRIYLGITQYVRFFTVTKIENDQPFREFFGLS